MNITVKGKRKKKVEGWWFLSISKYFIDCFWSGVAAQIVIKGYKYV